MCNGRSPGGEWALGVGLAGAFYVLRVFSRRDLLKVLGWAARPAGPDSDP